MERLRHLLSRIRGISTPLGGVSWSPSRVSKVPAYREPIYITNSDNDDFISFLETNDRRIVFLDTHLDASVTFKEQVETINKERLDLEFITSGKLNGVSLPLPNKKDDRVTVTFYFTDGHVLKYSAGGTGIITIGFRGFFEVSRTFHSGPTTAFHLKEIGASLEEKVDILNR